MKTKYLLGAAAAALVSTASFAQVQQVSAQRLSDITRTLGSDAFEGRGPATRAETKTVDYIIAQFKAAGVQPGGDIVNGQRTWTQKVPLLKSDIVGTPEFSLDLGAGAPLKLTQGEEISVKAPLNGMKTVDLKDVPLVFVGYEVTAPERQ